MGAKLNNQKEFSWIELLDLVENQINEANTNTEPCSPDEQIFLEVLDKYSEVCNFDILHEAKEDASSKAKAEEILLSLPKFVPTENWGKAKSAARKEIKKFVNNIGGRTVKDRIQFLRQIQDPSAKITSTRRIISSLILLESLQSIITSYGASSAGFVFEGFIAAMMNGEQVSDPAEGSLPIEDVMAFTYEGQRAGVPVSLKLLAGGKNKGVTKGSFKNLVDSLFGSSFDGMAYVVVFKEGEEGLNLAIREFTFTKENFSSILIAGSPGNKRLFGPNRPLMRELAASTRSDTLRQIAKTLSNSRNTSKAEDMVIAAGKNPDLSWDEYYDLIRATVSYSKELYEGTDLSTQFYLYSRFFYSGRGEFGMIDHGNLDISPETILSTTELYIDRLQETLVTLFSAVSALSDNINQFFVAKDRDRGMQNGKEAMVNTKEIQKSITKEMKEK